MRRVYSLKQSRENESSLDNDVKEHVNGMLSKLKVVDLTFSYSLFHFLFSFLFILFSIFYFRTRVKDKLIRPQSHKSHDLWKDVEGSGRMRSYSMYNIYGP